MSVTPVQYLGTGSDDVALALKTYSGVFAEAFRNQVKLANTNLPVIYRKTATGSKSFQILNFCETNDAEEEYTPGNDLAGQGFAVDEVTVTRDKFIVAHDWVPRDAMKTDHFEVLPRLAKAHARKVGLRIDRRLFITAALAARAAAVTKNGFTNHNGGNSVTRSGGTLATAYALSSTGAANFVADCRTLAQQMDEDNVPPDGRYMWLTPYMKHVLQYDNTAQLFSEDYIDGENKVQKRLIRLLAGFKIIADMVNTIANGGSFPSGNITTGPSKYQANFNAQTSVGIPAALVLCEGAVGDAAVSFGTWEAPFNFVQYYPEKLSWLVATAQLGGIGQMSPWLAGSIEVKT